MGKVGILAVALWSTSMCCAWAAMSVPAPYLEQHRCLAVLNVATAAFETVEPQTFTAGTHEKIDIAYHRMQHGIEKWSTLTPQQIDKGVDHFEAEMDQWIAAFGNANAEDMGPAFIEALFARVERCMKLVEH